MAQFIGITALQQLAVQITPEVAMSAYYNRQQVFEKFGINVISGIQFKNIKYVLLRKGHTTRRKVVGSTVQNQAGALIERPLTTYLAWNRYKDNKDSYREVPIVNEADGAVSYPASEMALRAVLANYADDIYDCFWHGDHEIADTAANAHLGLYDGIFTNINNDIVNGLITPIHLSGTITAPVSTSDQNAYNLFKEFRSAWDLHLQNAPKVYVAMNSDTAEAIADAYGNSKNNNKEVVMLANGNYSFPQWPNIEVAYDPSIGTGDRMIAYTPNNLEYGIDTENADNQIYVQEGSDNDAMDLFFQIQSAQGTRVYNISPSNFACTDSTLTPVGVSGDYEKATFSCVASDSTLGSVTVNGVANDPTVDYPAGTILTLKATPTGSATFVKWSNGQTATEIKYVTSGAPEAVVAIFSA